MDEVFGADNCVAAISFKKTSGAGSPAVKTDVLPAVYDQILWYAKSLAHTKHRQPFSEKADDFRLAGNTQG
jgi:adenine-specific DNA-methyltransferase